MQKFDSIKLALAAIKDAQMQRLTNKAKASLDVACEAVLDKFRNNPLRDREYSQESNTTAQDRLGWTLRNITGDLPQTTEFQDRKWRYITKTHWHTNTDGSKQYPGTFNAAGFCQYGLHLQTVLDHMNEKDWNFRSSAYAGKSFAFVEVENMVLKFLQRKFDCVLHGDGKQLGIQFVVDPFGECAGHNALPIMTVEGWLELCGLTAFAELIDFNENLLGLGDYRTARCMARGKINHAALWAKAEKIAADEWAAFEHKILAALEAFDIQEIESDPSQAFEYERTDLFITATNGCKFRLSCWFEDCTSVLGNFFVRWQLKFGDLKDPTGNKVKGASKAKALAMIDSH